MAPFFPDTVYMHLYIMTYKSNDDPPSRQYKGSLVTDEFGDVWRDQF